MYAASGALLAKRSPRLCPTVRNEQGKGVKTQKSGICRSFDTQGVSGGVYAASGALLAKRSSRLCPTVRNEQGKGVKTQKSGICRSFDTQGVGGGMYAAFSFISHSRDIHAV